MEQQNESDFGLAERKVLLDLEAGGRPAKKKPSKVIKRPSAKDRKINVPLQRLKSASTEQSKDAVSVRGSHSQVDIISLLSEESETEKDMPHREKWLEDGGVVILLLIVCYCKIFRKKLCVGVEMASLKRQIKGFDAHAVRGAAFKARSAQLIT